MSAPPSGGAGALINEVLTDDELRAVLTRLGPESERDAFGLVCHRWLRIQSSERRRLRARAGPDMLRRLAARFPGVLEIDLSQNPSRSFYPGVIDDDLDVIAGSFRNLRVLALQNCKGISDVGVAKLGDGLASLQSLDVSRCIKLSDKGLKVVALGCQKLRQLHITGCRLITDNLLIALSKSCLQLEDLGAAGCNSITDAGISALADGCHHIKLLDISKCNKVGDPGVCKIAEVSSLHLVSIKLLDCSKDGEGNGFQSELRVLKISSCVRLTVAGVSSVIKSFKALEYLDVRSCPQVTRDSCEQAGVQFPSACKVNFYGSLLESDPSAERFF
ncbi:unnamed protein product [Urochloa humidicola]